MDSKKVARELLALARQITAAPVLKPLYFKNTSRGGEYVMLKPRLGAYDVYYLDRSALTPSDKDTKFKRTSSVVLPGKLAGWASLNKLVQIPKEYVDSVLHSKPLRLP